MDKPLTNFAENFDLFSFLGTTLLFLISFIVFIKVLRWAFSDSKSSIDKESKNNKKHSNKELYDDLVMDYSSDDGGD